MSNKKFKLFDINDKDFINFISSKDEEDYIGEDNFTHIVPELSKKEKREKVQRADGKQWSESNKSNEQKEAGFTPNWIQEEFEREKILETDPLYQFIFKVAGSSLIQVRELYIQEDIDLKIKRTQYFQKQRELILREKSLPLENLIKELKILETEINNLNQILNLYYYKKSIIQWLKIYYVGDITQYLLKIGDNQFQSLLNDFINNFIDIKNITKRDLAFDQEIDSNINSAIFTRTDINIVKIFTEHNTEKERLIYHNLNNIYNKTPIIINRLSVNINILDQYFYNLEQLKNEPHEITKNLILTNIHLILFMYYLQNKKGLIASFDDDHKTLISAGKYLNVLNKKDDIIINSVPLEEKRLKSLFIFINFVSPTLTDNIILEEKKGQKIIKKPNEKKTLDEDEEINKNSFTNEPDKKKIHKTETIEYEEIAEEEIEQKILTPWQNNLLYTSSYDNIILSNLDNIIKQSIPIENIDINDIFKDKKTKNMVDYSKKFSNNMVNYLETFINNLREGMLEKDAIETNFLKKIKKTYDNKVNKKLWKYMGYFDIFIYPIYYFELWLNDDLQSKEDTIDKLKSTLEDIKNDLSEKKKKEYEQFEEPYFHDPNWVLSPENSGIIHLKPEVIQSINEAYEFLENNIQRNIPSLHSLQTNKEYSSLFASLVGNILKVNQTRSGNRYYAKHELNSINLAKANAIFNLKTKLLKL